MGTNLALTNGSRKTSEARATIKQGKGNILVNGRELKAYFLRDTLLKLIMQPLEVTDNMNKYDISLNVYGGGLTGQAGAVRLAIARALLQLDPNSKLALKKLHLLTRDSRMKERKKYGQRGARAKYQFSKR